MPKGPIDWTVNIEYEWLPEVVVEPDSGRFWLAVKVAITGTKIINATTVVPVAWFHSRAEAEAALADLID